MAYDHYKTHHTFEKTVTARGLITAGPVPTSANDATTLEPKTGEMRADATSIYMCTVGGATPTWVRNDFAAF